VSAVADKYAVLQKLGVEVISASVDSHFVHKMWNDHELCKMVEGGVPFHKASDQAGNVGRAYGVWNENQGIELRGRFIIDPDGVIQAMEVMTPPWAAACQKRSDRSRHFNTCARARAQRPRQPAGCPVN
jgi:peroxiredoxin (alkyl hydroperoxide reductase subunit C)